MKCMSYKNEIIKGKKNIMIKKEFGIKIAEL